MPQQASTVINQARILAATPNQNQGRWSDVNVLALVDMAQKHLVQELLFPETRLTGLTVAQQLYTLPDTHRVYRVYLNGQIATETDGGIDTLEGRQIGLTGYPSQGVLAVGSDGPPGSLGPTAPQWAVMTPMAYPYLSNLSAPSPSTQPSFIGQRLRYYIRGGSIGFVPQPTAGINLSIDCVVVPVDLLAPTQQLEVPTYFYDALVWYTVMMMKFADDSGQSAQDQRNFAEGKYQEHLKKLRTTIRQYSIKDTTQFVRNDRWRYQFGRSTTSNGWGNSW